MHDVILDRSMEQFAGAIAAAAAPDHPWTALQRLAQDMVGAKLFTIMTVNLDEKVARRLYTNMPDSYPVGGAKPTVVNPWFEQVVLGRKLFVANILEDIAKVFPDHELIGSLGCGSVVNLPVVLANKVLGTVNMLDAEHHYTAERVQAAERLKVPALAAFLVAERLAKGAARP